ncbi:MAG: alpha-amylase family glycosyl hydrolase [Clostridium sp.]|nr:alpha-amylase family glycosyl hydrolase [Clostridium sp.]
MTKLYSLLLTLLLAISPAAAQIITSSPSPLQTNSTGVTITFHADQGNKGLMGLDASTPVYAHTGVITNKSNGGWAYAPTWLDNAAKYKMQYVAANTYTLTIGDINTYYGITDASEVVEKLCFVFRTADGSQEGKTATGGDIFLDVLAAGFKMQFTSNAPEILTSATSTVTFTAAVPEYSSIKFYINDVNSTPFATAAYAKSLTKDYTFAAGSDYDVIAVATERTGEKRTTTETIHICFPPDSKQEAFPGGKPKMGATANADGTVTFCIAAPDKTNGMIIGAWNGYEASAKGVMNYADVDGIRYFWTKVSGLDPDTEYPYYYLIDGTYKVGDPYARLVLDPYSDKWLEDGTYPGLIPYPSEVEGDVMLAVYKGNRDKYDWKVKDFQGVAQSDLIIYEMLVRDFTGTEGQAYGNGTIAQAEEKLPYLKVLGVNAIELMPIQEFNGNNSWGYNTNFYFAPDKAYGSPDAYRHFIDACHSQGIAVILDVVFNQSDGLHPWYQMYEMGQNPFYNATAPHAYSVLNDWKQDNMLVQQQWIDMVAYWMTAYKADGFRFDLVKGLGDNASYGGNASEANTNKYNASRIARMKAITDAMRAINPNAYSINEDLAGAEEENAMAANGQTNWANINEASCQFAMGYSSGSNLNRFYAPNDSRTWGSTVSYAESHDEQRMAYKQDQWGAEGVKGDLEASMQRLGSVAAQMLLAPGAHMIWQFGELGNGTNTKNADGGNNTDPKPVLWSYLDVPARKGLYDNYCELIALRNENPDLFTNSATFSMACGESNWAAGRTIYASTADKELICVINPGLTQATITGVKFKAKSNVAYKTASASYGASPTFNAASGTVTLPGGCYAVFTNSKVAGIEDTVEAGGATVIGGDGEITIVGEYSHATAYDVYGRAMPSLCVPRGMYIVNVDGIAHKVIVR